MALFPKLKNAKLTIRKPALLKIPKSHDLMTYHMTSKVTNQMNELNIK